MRGEVDVGQGAAGEGGADEEGATEADFGVPLGEALDAVGCALTISTRAGMVVILVVPALDRVVDFSFFFFFFLPFVFLRNATKRYACA